MAAALSSILMVVIYLYARVISTLIFIAGILLVGINSFVARRGN